MAALRLTNPIRTSGALGAPRTPRAPGAPGALAAGFLAWAIAGLCGPQGMPVGFGLGAGWRLGPGSGLAAAATVEGRALWLTRWHSTTREEIADALDAMVALKMNILYVQVYGDGMALYASAVAPRSPLAPAPFDALAAAVDEGHRRGIEVHAYMNVCNVYSGGLGAPAAPAHLVRAHPEWSVVDSSGAADVDLVGTPDTMVFYCPEWDGFRKYCVDVAKEISTKYAVDGLHLDYLRFPGGAPRCFCAEHRRKFEAQHGREPEDTDPDFVEFRYETITRLFGEVYDAATAARPRIQVSASVISPNPRHFQDARRILEAGRLDVAVPMIYTEDTAAFEAQSRYFHENSGGRLVLAGIGIGSAGGEVGEEVAIARSVGLEGQAIFTFSTLDDAARAQLAEAYASPASRPPMPWKDGSADRTAPVISSLSARGILSSEATVTWHTDERTRGRVEHGLTSSLGTVTSEGASSFDHAVRITGLRPSTLYHFRVVSADAAGNETSSDRQTFRTAASGPVRIVVDDGDEGFAQSGAWAAGSSPGGNGGDYRYSTARGEETAWAEFRPYLPVPGRYEVALWYVAGSNRASDARFTVAHAAGNQAFLVDQRSKGQTWNALGTFRFRDGSAGFVRLSNRASGGDVVIADAVRFDLIEPEATFLRGDANSDGAMDMSDAVSILGALFLGAKPPACPDAADGNDSGTVDLSDAVFILNHLFLGSRPPPEPYPAPGADPTEDGLADC